MYVGSAAARKPNSRSSIDDRFLLTVPNTVSGNNMRYLLCNDVMPFAWDRMDGWRIPSVSYLLVVSYQGRLCGEG